MINKSVIKFVVFLSLILSFYSCEKDNDIFDKDPTERLYDKVNNTKNILTSANNGWIMKIYPSPDLRYGGFSVFMKFSADGTVSATNDIMRDNKTLVSSEYIIDGSDGGTLTFDTYNEIIHVFSEPASPIFSESLPKGGDGDFVFKIQSVSPDKIILKGVRSQVIAEMTPIGKDVDWNEELSAMKSLRRKLSLEKVSLSYSNTTIVGLQTSPFGRVITLRNGQKLPYVYTAKGIELYQETNIGGNLVKVFTADFTDKENPKLISLDGKVVITRVETTLAEKLVGGRWFTASSFAGPIGGRALAFAKIMYDRGLNRPYNMPFFFLGSYNSQSEGNGFGVWSSLSADGRDNIYRIPLVYKISDDKPNEITIEYKKNERSGSLGEALRNGFFYLLASPFAHIGSIEQIGYEDTVGPRLFKLTSDNDKNPTQIRMTDIDDPSNTITLANFLISNPLDPQSGRGTQPQI